MNTTVNTNRENMNAANIGASNKINDFGQKIGGARKDLYQAANEWAEKLADITAEALTKAGGVSKLVRLPNLESMAAAGAITADQARAALIIWRGIERKPQGRYRADRWAERTRARLEAAAAIITGTEPTTDEVADIIKAARESAEFAVISAANWPADPFTFGNYTVKYYIYSEPQKLRIIGGHYYRGEASTDPADIARQLREMTAADAEKAAESRAAGPRLGIYHTSDYTRYFIAVENKCEIVLKVCDTYQEATEAARNERAELLAKYDALRTFPALRRSWNRPRVGKEWHAEDVTPEQFAAVIPFKGVEFGNWLNQDERAALLNSAFDGFHDLADLLGIPAAAVSLGGRLNFSFATRGHAGSAAHFDSMYNTINLNKRNGAGCMAHEWLHACDHFAAVLAGRGSCTSWGEAFATECNKESNHPADIAARELVAEIRKMDYYTRSRNYQVISGKSQGGADYYTQPCELAARGFEGVVLYLLNCAGGCSDFLVNLQSWRDFERDDAGHRRDCYPYPSDAEAAALLPYYMAFFRALFGACEVSQKAAEGVAAATLQAAQEKAEADSRAAEKAEQERKESEARRAARRAELDRKAEEQRKEQERQAAEIKAKAEATRAAIAERLTAAHFDTIATDCDAAAVYFAAHLEGEIYTGKVEIKSDPAEIAAAVQAAPVACLQYKYIHNAKRVICHRWQVASVRSNKRTARELLASLQPSEVRAICRAFVDFERADNWQKAARIWNDIQRTREELNKRAQKPANEPTANEPTESATTAQGLTMEKYSEKATVIRGYNADQLAELLEMGGKEWRNLKGGKGVIFSTRRHGDELAAWMEAQQGEGTTAPATNEPAESAPAAIAASEEEGAPLTEPNRDGLPDWLHVGVRFCLLDFATGKPTAVRYTCAAIDYENKTVTIPEAADAFRGGSHVYRWDAFHWHTFAPITDTTDPTPEPSGEGDELADIISEAKKAEKWSANGKYNYGPIESLRAAAYKHTTTAEEYTKFFDEHLAEVTNAETYCVWLLRAYDITVDETQVFCDLRRAFPAIGFKEACKLIKDHMSPEQQGNGIAAALVPDFVLIESNDQNTREHFRKRHEKYTRTRAEGWNADKLRKCYDLESLAVHLLLEWELFYTWEADRAEKALEYLRECYPEATADDLHRVFMAASDGVLSIYN